MIYFHEDNYRQIELVPEENYFFTKSQIVSFQSPKTSIYGFSEIKVRKEQKIQLLERKISIHSLNEIINPISLSYSDQINTGYGQHVEKAKNIVVWGFEQYGIFIKLKQNIIEAIWLSDSIEFPQLKSCSRLSEAIFLVCQEYSLILVDWNKELICRAKRIVDIKDYLIENFSFE